MFEIPMRPRNLPRRLPDISAFVCQPKFDGWYVVFSDGRAYTRTGEDITGWACWRGRTLPANAVGELLHRDGRSRIQSLAQSADGLRVVLFDAPSCALIEDRLAETERIAAAHGFESALSMWASTWSEANGCMLTAQCMPNIEGLVLKRSGSLWTAGEQHHDWFRFKRSLTWAQITGG